MLFFHHLPFVLCFVKLKQMRVRRVVLVFTAFLLLIFANYENVLAKSIHCPGNRQSIDTAIGCIPVSNTTSFVTFILKWAFGIGGGIAFLLIVLASFQIMTSSGDPKKLQAGKELLTSAISGLLLLIFSVFILKVIGIDILGLGDFGFGQK